MIYALPSSCQPPTSISKCSPALSYFKAPQKWKTKLFIMKHSLLFFSSRQWFIGSTTHLWYICSPAQPEARTHGKPKFHGKGHKFRCARHRISHLGFQLHTPCSPMFVKMGTIFLLPNMKHIGSNISWMSFSWTLDKFQIYLLMNIFSNQNQIKKIVWKSILTYAFLARYFPFTFDVNKIHIFIYIRLGEELSV